MSEDFSTWSQALRDEQLTVCAKHIATYERLIQEIELYQAYLLKTGYSALSRAYLRQGRTLVSAQFQLTMYRERQAQIQAAPFVGEPREPVSWFARLTPQHQKAISHTLDILAYENNPVLRRLIAFEIEARKNAESAPDET